MVNKSDMIYIVAFFLIMLVMFLYENYTFLFGERFETAAMKNESIMNNSFVSENKTSLSTEDRSINTTHPDTSNTKTEVKKPSIEKVEKPEIEIKTPLFTERIIRWRSLPIPVYIIKEGRYDCTAYEDEIINAMNEWERVTGINFFFLTNDSNCINCVVVFCHPESEVKKTESGNYIIQTVGEAAPIYYVLGDVNVIGAGIVDIYRTSVQCIKPVRYIHEFGHILGLGHSSNSSDIMYPNEDCQQTISTETKETLINLYSKNMTKYISYLFSTETPRCENETEIYCHELCWEPIECGYGYYPDCTEYGYTCVANYTILGCPEGTYFCNGSCWECSSNYVFYCENGINPQCVKCTEEGIFCRGNCYEYCGENETFVCNETFAGCVEKESQYPIKCYGEYYQKCDTGETFYCLPNRTECKSIFFYEIVHIDIPPIVQPS